MRNMGYIKESTDQVVRQLSGYNSYGELVCETGKNVARGASGLFGFIGNLVEELLNLAEPSDTPTVPRITRPATKTCFRCHRQVAPQDNGLFHCPCGRRFR